VVSRLARRAWLLTTAAPAWNNWAQSEFRGGHASPGVLPQSLADVAAGRHAAGLELDPAVYQPQVRFLSPQSDGGATAAADGSHAAAVGSLAGTTDTSGFYERGSPASTASQIAAVCRQLDREGNWRHWGPTARTA
jgi:hypothetical protein